MYLYIDTYTHIRQQWSLLQDRLFLSFYIIYIWPVLCKTGGVKTLSFLHIYIQKLWRDKKETGWSQSRYRTEDKQEKVTFYYISCYTLLVLNQVNSLHVLKKKKKQWIRKFSDFSFHKNRAKGHFVILLTKCNWKVSIYAKCRHTLEILQVWFQTTTIKWK